MKRLAIIPMIGCLILGLHQQARAECLSEPSIASLCESGGLIIEGTWLGGDRVAVTRVWKAPASVPKDVKELKVVGLYAIRSRHSSSAEHNDARTAFRGSGVCGGSVVLPGVRFEDTDSQMPRFVTAGA